MRKVWIVFIFKNSEEIFGIYIRAKNEMFGPPSLFHTAYGEENENFMKIATICLC